MKILNVSIWMLCGLVGVGVFFSGCSRGHDDQSAAQEKTLYTCGMHPQIIQDHPGNCPICGMKLTPIRKQGKVSATGERKIKIYKSTMNPGETSPQPGKDSMGMDMVPVYEDAAGDSASTITIDPATTQIMGIRTEAVTRGPLRRVIRTVGTVDFDETHLTDVTTKFKGWIEKLHVDTTGQQVHRGDTLFEIYSPELYSAQVEYVLALNQSTNLPGGDTLKASALAKLKFYDISDEQTTELEKTRELTKTLRIASPSDGFVVEKMVVQGQMVDAGMKLYRIADLGLVWVQAQIYEQDLPVVKLGQEAVVKLSYLPDREFRGRVTYIYPTLDEKTRTARVRMEFHNPGYFLKPGMFATVELRAEVEPSVLLVPDSAVLRSGEKNTVFVALDGGRFDPRVVKIGLRAEGNNYQVLAGLSEGERVVTSGQFMLDSESQLREAIQKMTHSTTNETAMAQTVSATDTITATNTTATSARPEATSPVAYICPMPEHVSIKYDHPGKCAICGMTLVPVSQATLDKVQPGGRVAYYTCPMTEHSDVRSKEPGKCPRCGMTLIPVMETPQPPTQSNTNAVAIPSPLYTCPMASHADVVSEKPGDCPKCGMTLVETSTVNHGKIAEGNWRKQHQH
jgi:membrane fusion protein, copper/silver efflux system